MMVVKSSGMALLSPFPQSQLILHHGEEISHPVARDWRLARIVPPVLDLAPRLVNEVGEAMQRYSRCLVEIERPADRGPSFCSVTHFGSNSAHHHTNRLSFVMLDISPDPMGQQ